MNVSAAQFTSRHLNFNKACLINSGQNLKESTFDLYRALLWYILPSERRGKLERQDEIHRNLKGNRKRQMFRVGRWSSCCRVSLLLVVGSECVP